MNAYREEVGGSREEGELGVRSEEGGIVPSLLTLTERSMGSIDP